MSWLNYVTPSPNKVLFFQSKNAVLFSQHLLYFCYPLPNLQKDKGRVVGELFIILARTNINTEVPKNTQTE